MFVDSELDLDDQATQRTGYTGTRYAGTTYTGYSDGLGGTLASLDTAGSGRYRSRWNLTNIYS